jgi:hypothetical protein
VHARTILFILLAKYHVNFRSKKNKNKKACSYYNTVANFKVELQPKGPSSEANFKMIKRALTSYHITSLFVQYLFFLEMLFSITQHFSHDKNQMGTRFTSRFSTFHVEYRISKKLTTTTQEREAALLLLVLANFVGCN